MSVPQYADSIAIDGHQAKILVADFHFGSKNLLYSTAEVLTFAIFGENEVLVLWLPAGEQGEFTIEGIARLEPPEDQQLKDLAIHPGESNITVAYTQEEGMFTLDLEDGSTIVLLDRGAAYLFWVPALNNDPFVPEDQTGAVSGCFFSLSYKITDSVSSSRPRPVPCP